jgi:hypothetical protein
VTCPISKYNALPPTSVAFDHALFAPPHRLLVDELNGGPGRGLLREVGLLEPGAGHGECSRTLRFRPGRGAVGRLHVTSLLSSFGEFLGRGSRHFSGGGSARGVRGVGLGDCWGRLDPADAGKPPGEPPDAAAEEVERHGCCGCCGFGNEGGEFRVRVQVGVVDGGLALLFLAFDLRRRRPVTTTTAR